MNILSAVVNRNLAKVAFSVTLALQLVACGKKDPEGVKPLSTTDKQKVLAVVKSTVRSVGAATKTASLKNKSVEAGLKQFSRSLGIAADYSESGTEFQTMTAELEDCSMNQTGLEALENGVDESDFGQAAEGSASLSGENCPIDLTLKSAVPASTDGKTMKGSFSASYKVKKDEFKKLNDVDAFDFSVEMAASQPKENALSLTINMSSKIHSQQSGDITFGGNFTLVGAEGSVNVDSKFEFTGGGVIAVFEIKGDSKTDKNGPKILLNGQPLTPEEIQAIASELSGTGESTPSAPGESPKTNPGPGSSGGAGPTPKAPTAPANGSRPVAGQPYLGTFENGVGGEIVFDLGGVAKLVNKNANFVATCSYAVSGPKVTLTCKGAGTVEGQFSPDYSQLDIGGDSYFRL